MKKMKIIIKCEGLLVRTKDLGMGLSVLNRISNNGIMNHSFISNSFLDKASKIMKQAHDKLVAALNRQASVKETIKEEINEMKEPVEKESKYYVSNKRKKAALINEWTIDEDKIICDTLDKSPNKVSRNKDLRVRHTINAIKTRISIYKNRRFYRIGSDRAKIMQAYLSGEKISTPVVDINKHVFTPITDKIEQDVENGKYDNKKGYIDKRGKMIYPWTKEEITRLKENINLKGEKLHALFPNRTLNAIQYKRGEVRDEEKNSDFRSFVMEKPERSWTEREEQIIIDNANLKSEAIRSMLVGRTRHAVLTKRSRLRKEGRIENVNVVQCNKWTQEEDDAIKLNINMNRLELSKLPWLKDRTLDAIANRKYYLINESKKSNENN